MPIDSPAETQAPETTEQQPPAESTPEPATGAIETPPQDNEGAQSPVIETDAAVPVEGVVEPPAAEAPASNQDPMPTRSAALAAVGRAFSDAFASLSDLMSSTSLLPTLNQPISNGMVVNSYIAIYQSLQLPPAETEEPQPGATDEASALDENGLLIDPNDPKPPIDVIA